MKSVGLIAAVLTAFIALTGCGKAKEQHAWLDVALENTTSERINEATVVFGKYRCVGGVIIPGAAKTHLDWRPPVGTNAVVEWRDSKQVKQAVLVSLAGVYDPTVEGQLIFSVGPTNVTVRFKKGR